MISLLYVFYIFVAFMAIIGAVRGWAKETLVLFSALLALFIIVVLEQYVPVYKQVVAPSFTNYVVQQGDTCQSVADNFSVPLRSLIAYNNLSPSDCALNPGTGLNIPKETTKFYINTFIVLFFAFFGYQTPMIKYFQAAARREKVRDALLGAIAGGANGWLVVGTIWSFLHTTGYEYFAPALVSPELGTKIAERTANIISRMPPELIMQEPLIYFLIALAFGMVLIVYI